MALSADAMRRHQIAIKYEGIWCGRNKNSVRAEIAQVCAADGLRRRVSVL
jgi:hypothetical protein